MGKGLTRRELLQATAVAAGAAALPVAAKAQRRRERKRVLRIAHLTDVHVQPERNAAEGMAKAIVHAQSLADPPDIVFTGGDLIMDAFAADYVRTRQQWKLWGRVLRDSLSLPVEHCIGNHDVWGWDSRESNPAHAVLSGKKWALDALGLERPYRSFDRAGWHFVVLDSTHPAPRGSGYVARLDEEQFAWLKADLAETPATTPVLVMSHIPILAVCVFFDGNNVRDSNWNVPGAWMHIDAGAITQLFKSHPNVKACISGHIHLVDDAEYLGVRYLCDGAVSGAWWKGNYHECPPGYAVLDLYDDGTLDRRYIAWGWQAE